MTELSAEKLAELREIAGRATGGPWHWAGNTDTGEPYLATWIKGAGRCQVLSIGSEDRSMTGSSADSVREYAEESGMDPDALVHDWAHDSFGNRVKEPRLQFMTDLMCVDARDLAVYEVAPEATSRDDSRVYRADVVGVRHPDARHMAAFDPPTVLALLDLIAEQQTRIADLETYFGQVIVQEYGEVNPHGGDDGETVTLHKHFGDDKSRPLEEGYALGARWVGPWMQIGEVQRYE